MEIDRDALLDLERRRCDAIARGDAAALQALLTDDYVHVHMTGKVDDRAGHIQAVAARPRTPERGPDHVKTLRRSRRAHGRANQPDAGCRRAARACAPTASR